MSFPVTSPHNDAEPIIPCSENGIANSASNPIAVDVVLGGFSKNWVDLNETPVFIETDKKHVRSNVAGTAVEFGQALELDSKPQFDWLGLGKPPSLPLDVVIDDGQTNKVSNGAKIAHTTPGIPAAGIGVRHQFEIKTSSGNNEILGEIEVIATDVTIGDETSKVTIKNFNAGAENAILTMIAQMIGVNEPNPGRTLHASLNDGIDNAVTQLLRITHKLGFGDPLAGIGVGIEFETETATGNNLEIGSTIESVAVEVGTGAENFDLVFKLMKSGAPAAERLRITSDGAIDFIALTTAQRDAITGPGEGLFIYNSDNKNFEWYNGSAWVGAVNIISNGERINPGALSVNPTHNWNLSLTPSTRWIRGSSTIDVNITGIVAPSPAVRQIIDFTNITGFKFTFQNENASSTAVNRFAIGNDLDVESNETATLIYDTESSRWRIRNA